MLVTLIVPMWVLSQPPVEGPTPPPPGEACASSCNEGQRCNESGICVTKSDPVRARYETRLRSGRKALIVGGSMLGSGLVSLGVGLGFFFTAGEDDDDLTGAFLITGGSIVSVASLVVLLAGEIVYEDARATLQQLDKGERPSVRLRPSFRRGARGTNVGANLEIRF